MFDKNLLENLKKITNEEQKILDGESVDKELYMGCGNIINSKKMLAKGKQIAVRPHVRFVDFPEVSEVCFGKFNYLIYEVMTFGGGSRKS